MLNTKQKIVRNLLKVCVASAVVTSAFGAIVALYPSIDRGELAVLRESNADIFAMSFAQPTNTEKFGSALEQLGHEPPRVYRANQNAVFFSTAVFHNRRPNEVLREYQEEFVRQGINKSVHLTPVSTLARQNTAAADAEIQAIEEAAMSGEIIPYQVGRNGMSMGGTVMDLDIGTQDSETFERIVRRLESNVGLASRAYEACGGSQDILKVHENAKSEVTELAGRVERAAVKAESCSSGGGFCSDIQDRYAAASQKMSALKAAVDEQPTIRKCQMMRNAARAGVEEHKDEFARRIKAFRAIEATYDAKANATHVSATWSNEEFDATKFRQTKTGNLDETKVSQSLPLCDGCRRTWDFGGSASESDYSTTQLNSPNSAGLMADYYVRRLEREGWTITESQHVSDTLMNLTNEHPESRWLRLVRGGEHLTVRITPDSRGGSRITATTAN